LTNWASFIINTLLPVQYSQYLMPLPTAVVDRWQEQYACFPLMWPALPENDWNLYGRHVEGHDDWKTQKLVDDRKFVILSYTYYLLLSQLYSWSVMVSLYWYVDWLLQNRTIHHSIYYNTIQWWRALILWIISFNPHAIGPWF